MTYSLFRSIYQQLAKTSKMEPNIANHFKILIKSHLQKYYQNQTTISLKLKKQKNTELLQAFLKFITIVNSKGTYNAYRTKVKTVQIFTGINMYVDKNCNIRPQNISIQMKELQKFNQYLNLDKNDKQFVRRVIKKVFLGEQTYYYSNLTTFFNQDKQKQKGKNKNIQQYLKQLDPAVKQYTDKAIKGDIIGISPQYIKIYQKIFDKQRNQLQTNAQQVFNSYLESNYILINFDDINSR